MDLKKAGCNRTGSLLFKKRRGSLNFDGVGFLLHFRVKSQKLYQIIDPKNQNYLRTNRSHGPWQF